MMAARGRGRSQRPEGRKIALPSRFLWVGNLSNSVTEGILVNHFARFGELERVSLQIGRNFAFVDYKTEAAAFAAIRGLHGFVLAGSPIIVEFTKDNKSSSQPFVQQASKPDPRTVEDLPPSEALWVGYPPQIQVDENILRKTFSPFGNIRKITTFSDRSYAFVTFETISSASLAKMTLEGKLFNNPRVQIRFAKSESGYIESGRQSKTLTLSPPIQDRNFGNVARYNEDISVPFHGVKKMRTGLFGLEDDLPEFSLSSAPKKPKEWEWEGVIGKGGKRVCRARCFPVGKPMDMMLPTFIDCTARTSLEMLSKHYYQAPSSWVVFFVPQTDADIESYNDFMHYLGEKQRVAVAKINENTTLFLVAPSEFSENVLKVPGKLSISGVVLRLEPQNPASEPTNGNLQNYPSQNTVITEMPRGSPIGPISSTLRPDQIASLASSVLGKRSAGYLDHTYGVEQGYVSHGASYSTGNALIVERPHDSSNVHVPALPSEQEEQLAEDSDPGRRLQATLQLAATLLQNVQQRRGS